MPLARFGSKRFAPTLPGIATRATAILPRFSRRRRLRQPPRCIWDRSRSACRGDRALIANAGLASRSRRCRSNVQNNDAGDDDLDWSSKASEPVRSARREVTDVGIEPIHRLEATMCPFPKFRPSGSVPGACDNGRGLRTSFKTEELFNIGTLAHFSKC